jgi:hypothetical protein
MSIGCGQANKKCRHIANAFPLHAILNDHAFHNNNKSDNPVLLMQQLKA